MKLNPHRARRQLRGKPPASASSPALSAPVRLKLAAPARRHDWNLARVWNFDLGPWRFPAH